MIRHNLYRMLFIESKLILNQAIVRRDITVNFLIAQATASRDIADYRELAPDNMTFIMSPKKAWVRSAIFEPVFFVSNAFTIEEQAEKFLCAMRFMVLTCSMCNTETTITK